MFDITEDGMKQQSKHTQLCHFIMIALMLMPSAEFLGMSEDENFPEIVYSITMTNWKALEQVKATNTVMAGMHRDLVILLMFFCYFFDFFVSLSFFSLRNGASFLTL